jgi:hypothetical protein
METAKRRSRKRSVDKPLAGTTFLEEVERVDAHSLDVALAVFVEALIDFPAARFCIPERDGARQHDSDNNQDCD